MENIRLGQLSLEQLGESGHWQLVLHSPSGPHQIGYFSPDPAREQALVALAIWISEKREEEAMMKDAVLEGYLRQPIENPPVITSLEGIAGLLLEIKSSVDGLHPLHDPMPDGTIDEEPDDRPMGGFSDD
jgi:hypothetical protein